MDKIQSIVLEKRLFNAAKARKWLSAHGYSSKGLMESANSFRAHQMPMEAFVTTASKSLAQGVQVVSGKVKEAVAAGANSPLLRAKSSVTENATISAPVSAGVFKVILISEGLGNRANMNYYGPEAISSAPSIFEGKPCYLNHPSESEENDIPERRVEQQCGFFKNCKVENINGQRAVTGELTLESTPQGDYARKKCEFALLYRREMPASPEEYCGFSVAAAGESERRTVKVDGKYESVNYLTAFTAARSCDMVTTPARGGKILQLLESKRNLNPMEKKTVMKELHKQIQDTLAKLGTSLGADEKADAGVKAAVAELTTLCGGLSAEPEAEKPVPLEDEAKPVEPPAEPVKPAGDPDKPAAPAAKEDEAAQKPAPAAAVLSDEPKPADLEKPAGSAAPAPVAAPKEEEPMEAQRLAIKFLLSEAGAEVVKVLGDKVPTTLKEARARIADVQATIKTVKESVMVAAGNPPKGGQEGAYTPKL